MLDESTATALAGEARDLMAISTTCCYLINACERVRDYDRAAQWYHKLRDFSKRWRPGTLFAICRNQYATLLIARGEWKEAETELTAAAQELMEHRPALVAASTVRLAELRRRQGLWDEAARGFSQVEHHILSILGRGLLALDQGDAGTALEFAERFLRRVSPRDKTERAPGLELLVRAHVALDQLDAAKGALKELQAISTEVPTDPFCASASYVEALVLRAEGSFDLARQRLEDAVDLFDRSGLPYDAARCRLELARTLVELDRLPRAESDVKSALETFNRLGAMFDVKQAEKFLDQLRSKAHAPSAANVAGLTHRETEILGLISAGKSNEEIADALFVSVRTVERHISNIYLKIGVSGKAARAAAASFAIKNGLGSTPAR